ncbi:coproporphyrinogen III oxidase [Rhodobacter veldkampii DSM 11550]|uniref:coproporphyrinogen oxidase n=1 Tax=Phaeovulum veldkampii DSM 11550 TaxID=1185920 RepID=A0A2T4JJW3_9RHOB|nr:oxygen-dependent coproporphyrinogen oxidase [Phaeovulum veldkampii]MBK5946087.1 coproporphyrinogen III oxidase [Phaeovulum veldkampii DSM 11550]PTE18186.1 oxygen-dependent coproporphyrinogen oxidase [Phaeovulum veldkampii DSM 11550]TDQ63513.1 coproporphyrinogen oxidase [Phaeovulum veldkampii DSM 11550]
MTEDFTGKKETAAAWFRTLRDRIVTACEALEDAADSDARFESTPTRRTAPDGSDAGGGLMSVLRGGKVFEKMGVAVSAVHGTLNPRAQAAMAARGVPGMAQDPRFWASGISLVAHMQNPHCPAVHMNTRMFWTPGAWWFGGGSDLNPCIVYPEDTIHFHAVMKAACDAHAPDYYPRFKAWADEYFFVPHRGRARGEGGIFFDDLNTGDWEADFAFVKSVGEAFLPAFLPLVARRQATPWTEADRETQLVHRGLYAEYNLIIDRGTKFGLETGHDANAVLMTMPPIAKWP